MRELTLATARFKRYDKTTRRADLIERGKLLRHSLKVDEAEARKVSADDADKKGMNFSL